MTYKLKVEDRNYEKYSIYHSTSLTITDISIHPIREKLFDQDIFHTEGTKVSLVHSSVRQMSAIPGVLVVHRTFGRWKRDKFLYQCIPDDRRLPIFLVSHKLTLGFHKKKTNKYITFKFLNWDKKHPQGTIVQVIGTVDQLEHFYEYQLYCKSLYASIQKFTKAALKALKLKSEQHYIDTMMERNTIEDRREWEVYTIDPLKSKDYDDGFGLRLEQDEWILSIYIANVSLWMDSMDIWASFSKRIATIYLPDRRRPMLPTILSDALCSLQEQQTRFAFTLDIHINKETYEIERTNYVNSCICVRRNYDYDSPELKSNPLYKQLTFIIKELNKHYTYVDHLRDSHDLVAYLMIMMNFLSAQQMCSFKTGIFRAISFKKTLPIAKEIPQDIHTFLKGWMSSGGKYVTYENKEAHAMLGLDAYIHITSPIRRIIDLLNIINLQDKLNICTFSQGSKIFYDNWMKELDYINQTMRAIRKVQNDSSLLAMCFKQPEKLLKIYDGFVFERIERNDGLFQYLVYLSELKMMNRITIRHSLKNHSMHHFKIYLFMDEDRLKQKIRLELVDSHIG